MTPAIAPSPVSIVIPAPVPVAQPVDSSPVASPATYFSPVGCFQDAVDDVNDADAVEGRIMGSKMFASPMSAEVLNRSWHCFSEGGGICCVYG